MFQKIIKIGSLIIRQLAYAKQKNIKENTKEKKRQILQVSIPATSGKSLAMDPGDFGKTFKFHLDLKWT